jgi:pyruvate ferredoxin oxidoreductase gamma subunit
MNQQNKTSRAEQQREAAETMLSVRFHGRGGQGVVTAAELLAQAAFSEGKYAQAFPSFGSERMGAPVTSFCRIDNQPIRTHEPVTDPDALLIQDPTLLHQADLFAGLTDDGYILINSPRDLEIRRSRLVVVPASQLAMTFLRRPLPGAAMLGAFAALTGAVGIDGVVAAIRHNIAPREHHVFAGKLDLDVLELPHASRRAFRGIPGNFRDWDEITHWAGDIASQLPGLLRR